MVHWNAYPDFQNNHYNHVLCTYLTAATLLTCDDLGDLKRLIQPVAAHWVALADQLRMTSLVATIQSTPRNNTSPDFLRDLLYRWLMKGHHTLEELCQALRKDVEIGGAGVADELVEEFQGRRGVETGQMLNLDYKSIP